VKTIRVQLPAVTEDDAGALLDLVTQVEGVVAALLDMPSATMRVVVSSEASALHVREQLAAVS
jgi:hypothetical protein